MKDEIKDKIIEKQAELLEILKRQIHVSGLLYPPSKVIKDMNRLEELESDLASLKSQLSEAGEEKPIIKKCRQCRFFDGLGEHCEPCETCYPIAYSNWQPR